MTDKTYVTLTETEKRTLTEALEAEFGQNRISQGAYIRLLAGKRLE